MWNSRSLKTQHVRYVLNTGIIHSIFPLAKNTQLNIINNFNCFIVIYLVMLEPNVY